MPMLVGNLVAILSSALVCVVVSLIKPDRYDWKSTREISMVDDAETGAPRAAPAARGKQRACWDPERACAPLPVRDATTCPRLGPVRGQADAVLLAAAACCGLRPSEAARRARAAPRAGFEAEGPDSAAAMEHAYKFVLRYGSILAVVLIIVWPLLALAAGTFTRPYFYFWVILSIVWGLARAPSGCSGDCLLPQSARAWTASRYTSL